MSLLSMASVAVARDHAELDQPLTEAAIVPQIPAAELSGGANLRGQTAARQPRGAEETSAGGVAGFGQLLVAQIPSEALLAYTTLLASPPAVSATPPAAGCSTGPPLWRAPRSCSAGTSPSATTALTTPIPRRQRAPR
jgi:hypothetical protein